MGREKVGGVWELVILFLTLDNPPWAKPGLKGQAGPRLPMALLRVPAVLVLAHQQPRGPA